MRRGISNAGLLCVVIATAALGGTAAAARTATATCSRSNLVVWLDTAGNGAAGSVYYKLEFTNLSRRTCRLFGFPGVSAVDVGGHQLGNAASRDHSRRATTALLAPGTSATAVLRIVDADNFPRSACRQSTAAGMRVYPPGERSSKIVPFPFRACSRRGPTYLDVQPVRTV